MVGNQFNIWWNSDDQLEDNPYEYDTAAYWAYEGWYAALQSFPSTDKTILATSVARRKQKEIESKGFSVCGLSFKLKDSYCIITDMGKVIWKDSV